MKKTERILFLLLMLSIFSCQSNRIIFQNHDFEKVKKHNDGLVLGEILMIIDFQEAIIKGGVFCAKGYVLSEESSGKLSGVSIFIEKGNQRKLLYKTKENGYFEIKVDNFSQYEILRFLLTGYVMEYYEISTLLEEKSNLK